MKVFISWSDETSHAIAKTLGEWISSVIQAAETQVSPEDIRKGTNWVNEISKELNNSFLAILCVVPDNLEGSWLNFEAGVLLKFLDISKVIPFLVNVERSELDKGPLAQFPFAICEKNEMYQILETINEKTEQGRLSKERLRNVFDVWWPKLQMDVDSILEGEITDIPDIDQLDEAPDSDRPEEAPVAEKPEKEPETEEQEKEPVAKKQEKELVPEKTEKAPDTENPEKAQESKRPEKEPDTEQQEGTPDTEKQEKKPERSVKPARKSEAVKTEDPEKPKKTAPPKPSLVEMEIELLKALYKPPGYTPMTAATVGQKLDIPSQKAREYLDVLERRNYVREHLYVGRPKEYSIAPKGREYLTKNDLVNKR